MNNMSKRLCIILVGCILALVVIGLFSLEPEQPKSEAQIECEVMGFKSSSSQMEECIELVEERNKLIKEKKELEELLKTLDGYRESLKLDGIDI